MKPNTHLMISPELCGMVEELEDGKARVSLSSTEEMQVDERGLVHGGFVFGLADYAAMLAVNDPNVVLGAAESRFLAPVKVGDVVVAEAHITGEKGKKRIVEASATVGDRVVFTATFTAFVLAGHVFDA